MKTSLSAFLNRSAAAGGAQTERAFFLQTESKLIPQLVFAEGLASFFHACFWLLFRFEISPVLGRKLKIIFVLGALLKL